MTTRPHEPYDPARFIRLTRLVGATRLLWLVMFVLYMLVFLIRIGQVLSGTSQFLLDFNSGRNWIYLWKMISPGAGLFWAALFAAAAYLLPKWAAVLLRLHSRLQKQRR